MAIVLSSLLATLVGGCVVYLTSPTLMAVLAGGPLTPLIIHSLGVDILFAILIAFLILCYVEHKWVAINQSFPYTFHLKRNVGAQAFDFQSVVFELWHTNKLNRYVHMICLFNEQFFWLIIIRYTFGLYGMLLANLLALTQAITWRDLMLTLTIGTINAAFSFAGLAIFERFDALWSLDICKVILFWWVVLRTAVHAAEPLPPTYDSETKSFQDAWGADAGYFLIAKEPFRATWLFILGIVSELASGIPGRLFGTAVYKVIFRLGYRSGNLKGVDEARQEAINTMENGWGSNPMLAPFFIGVSEGWNEKIPLEA